MDLHGAFHVYDTTLRDGAQQEGLNLSVADKLTIARQLDGLGVGYIEGGWPGANPKDTEFFRRAAAELDLQAREAGGLRRHPPGRRRGRRRPAGRRAARQRRLRGHPGRQVARPARRARAADHARGEPRDDPRHRLPPARPRGSRSSWTPSTSSTATAPTATTRSRCCARRTTPAPTWSRCATPTAGCCPTGSPTSCTTSSRPPASGSASTPQRHRLRGRELAGRRRRRRHATCRAASTGTASAPATPTWSRSSPTSSSSWTGRCCRPGCSAEATRIAHAVAEVTNVPPASRQPYVGASAFAHKAGLHASAIKVDPNLYQHMDPVRRRQRHAAAGLRHGRPRVDRAEGPRARLRPRLATGSWSPGSPPGSRSSSRPGYTFEAADASFELLLEEMVDGPPSVVLRRRVVAGDHRDARPPRGRRGGGLRGDREAPGRRASGTSSPARATARSTRSTRRCARRSARRSRRS